MAGRPHLPHSAQNRLLYLPLQHSPLSHRGEKPAQRTSLLFLILNEDIFMKPLLQLNCQSPTICTFQQVAVVFNVIFAGCSSPHMF